MGDHTVNWLQRFRMEGGEFVNAPVVSSVGPILLKMFNKMYILQYKMQKRTALSDNGAVFSTMPNILSSTLEFLDFWTFFSQNWLGRLGGKSWEKKQPTPPYVFLWPGPGNLQEGGLPMHFGNFGP